MVAVRSADRTLQLFETFEALKRPIVLSELAERMGIPISSCHGLVQTLMQRGYLYSLGTRKAIYPTRKVLVVAENVVANDPILELMETKLKQLRDETKETVLVGKRQGEAILYLAVVEGLHAIRYTASVGEFKPLHSTAIGKAFLGTLSKDALSAWLNKRPLSNVTKSTLSNRALLEQDLASSRKLGYFVTHGENVVDVSAIAITLELSQEILGVAVAGPAHRLRGKEPQIARLISRTCRQLGAEIG
jgi:IclR family transcriptional regulator, acetate operon repressor